MDTVNDTLARQIIHASITGGPNRLRHYQSPTHPSATGWGPLDLPAGAVIAAIRALPERIAARIAPAPQPACCPAV